jgi:hypothetical protein
VPVTGRIGSREVCTAIVGLQSASNSALVRIIRAERRPGDIAEGAGSTGLRSAGLVAHHERAWRPDITSDATQGDDLP